MEPPYATPSALLEALRRRGHGAREQLWYWLREPVDRLMRQLAERHRADAGHERMTRHALHLAETWLRTRPVDEFGAASWAGFRAALLLHVGKQAYHPYGGQNGTAPGPASLPDGGGYQYRTLFLPHDRVGGLAFGGDWFVGRHDADGALWILLADVTGHGYAAYLLASALPAVWQNCWEAGPPAEPAELLLRMHALLEECLPDGVYVEATLARLDVDGVVTVAPAGGTRLLLRKAGRVEQVRLRGGWLGLMQPNVTDQYTLTLGAGDELLLGTDGFFDQLADLGEDGARDLRQMPVRRALFDHANELLRRALDLGEQKDDITVVLLRRRPDVDGGPRTLPFPAASRYRAGHVSM